MADLKTRSGRIEILHVESPQGPEATTRVPENREDNVISGSMLEPFEMLDHGLCMVFIEFLVRRFLVCVDFR